MDRENKRRKRETNVLETRKNEEKKKDKQMNKSMSKGTYRGNAWMEKGIS